MYQKLKNEKDKKKTAETKKREKDGRPGAVGVGHGLLPAFGDGRLAAGGPQLLYIVYRCCRTMLAAIGCMVWAAEEICRLP